MTTINAESFRDNLNEYLRSAVKYNDVIDVNTVEGCAVVMSKEEYDGLISTLYLLSNPATAKEILEARKEADSEFIPIEDIEW